MELLKKLAIFIVTVSLLIEAGLLCGLFTNEWIKAKDYYFGIRRYCYNTKNDTSCHNVVDILPDLKDWLDAVYYLSSGACGWIVMIGIVMISSSCCNGCEGKKTRRCTSLVMLIWCCLQCAVVTIFITQIAGSLPESGSSFGWSLYLELTILGVLSFLLIIQIITGCCCKDGCCENSASVGVTNEPPRFIQPPGDKSVSVGKDVIFRTKVENANNVIWNKGNKRVIQFSTCHREDFNEAKGEATLSITKTRFQDDGVYMCIAEKYGKTTKEVHHEIHLYVLPVKPEFLKELVDTTVITGNSLELEAEVRRPESVTSVTWQRDGENITSSKGRRQLFRDGKLILKIANVTVKDSGEYSCKAKSKGSSSQEEESVSHCHVTVHAALSPSFENEKGDKQVIEGKTFELEIRVNGYPRPQNVHWYKGDGIIQENRRVMTQYLNGVGKLTVYDSRMNDSGIYECIAINEHGTAKCRISVKVKVESKQENIAECPVCIERLPNRVLECGHAFCEECLERIHGICPTCRAPFREPSRLFLN